MGADVCVGGRGRRDYSGVLDFARLLSAAFGPPPPDCGLPVAGGDGEGGEGGGFRLRPSP